MRVVSRPAAMTNAGVAEKRVRSALRRISRIKNLGVFADYLLEMIKALAPQHSEGMKAVSA
jgi:hypothetical protein